MVTVYTVGGFTLWIQALNVPSTLAVGRKTESVMKAMFTIRPELDFPRHDHEATPVRRARHIIGEAFIELGNRVCKCFT